MKKHKYEIELKDIELLLNGVNLLERQIRDDEFSLKTHAIDYTLEGLLAKLEKIKNRYDRLDQIKSTLSANLPKILDDIKYNSDDIPF